MHTELLGYRLSVTQNETPEDLVIVMSLFVSSSETLDAAFFGQESLVKEIPRLKKWE